MHDVSTSMIIFGRYSRKPTLWPSADAAAELLRKFDGQREKRESFLLRKIEKIKMEIEKEKRKYSCFRVRFSSLTV